MLMWAATSNRFLWSCLSKGRLRTRNHFLSDKQSTSHREGVMKSADTEGVRPPSMNNVLYPYLRRASENKDVLFLTDHGKAEILGGLRLNVASKTQRFTILPRWIVTSFSLFFYGLLTKKSTVYVTRGNRVGFTLILLQRMLKAFIHPRPHVLFDCFWEKGGNIMTKALTRFKIKLLKRSYVTCIVYGRKDIESLNSIYGIPSHQIVYVPYHHTLRECTYEVDDGSYIFSGSREDREFDDLIEICSELNIRLRIATMSKRIIELGKTKSVSTIRETTHCEFRSWMAESRMVVVVPDSRKIVTVGHQTFLNAMYMGKAVVIYDKNIADGYVEDGITGVVVAHGDKESLKRKVWELYNSPEERTRLGEAGRRWVIERGLGQDEWTYRVYEIAASEYYKGVERELGGKDFGVRDGKRKAQAEYSGKS